jgi:hypothetical protein
LTFDNAMQGIKRSVWVNRCIVPNGGGWHRNPLDKQQIVIARSRAFFCERSGATQFAEAKKWVTRTRARSARRVMTI